MSEETPRAMKILIRVLFIVPLLIFAGTLGYLYFGLDPDRDPRAVPSALIDKPAPEFALPAVPGLDTPGLSRADLEGGEPVLLNVFASWCVPCRAEHPVLSQLVEERGVTLYGIDYKDKAEDAVAWLEELGNPYAAIGHDENGRAGIEWGITGVPETFVIDGEGTIRYRHAGPLTARQIEEEILPVLEQLR